MLKHPYSIFRFTVKSYHSDQNGKLSLQAFFQLLQECAWDNARLNNFGYEYLMKENAFWVLSRVLVQIDKYPEWKDEIEIKTWPKGTDGFFALRDFEIYLKGEIIGRASSSWLILDTDTRRPRKLENFNFIHDNFIQEGAIDRKLEKIVFKGELNKLERRKVYQSDLDVNQHVNNATYVRWIMDSYFSDSNSGPVFEFEINFISELSQNDEFTIHNLDFNQENYFVLKNLSDKEVCRARIKS